MWHVKFNVPQSSYLRCGSSGTNDAPITNLIRNLTEVDTPHGWVLGAEFENFPGLLEGL